MMGSSEKRAMLGSSGHRVLEKQQSVSSFDELKTTSRCLSGVPLSITQVWDICLQFEYDEEELCDGLEEWLRHYKGKQIIDCACGTGFPSLRLIQRGYDIVCSDGSVTMLDELERKARTMGLNVKPHHLMWSELSSEFGEQFDVVICRGCSLIYASSWDRDQPYNRDVIEDALRNFHGCLAPGGVLYVDVTSKENLERNSPLVVNYPARVIDGHQVHLFETIETDKTKRMRTWRPTITIDGEKHTLTRHSYYLPHAELTQMLRDVGFTDIEKRDIKGEHYAVFTAKKPR